MGYNYGKTFKKDGKSVRYRYTDKKASSKKLVPVRKARSAKKTKR